MRGRTKTKKLQTQHNSSHYNHDIIIIPIPKCTTNIQIHHFKTTFMFRRSIAGVPFDSVRRFQASLLLHTTCDHP